MVEDYTQADAPLRALMDQYEIRVRDEHSREYELTSEWTFYTGDYPIIEIQFKDRVAFFRYEDIVQSIYGWDLWLTRFPDKEARILYGVLRMMSNVRWHTKHGGMQEWLYESGFFGSPLVNEHEWEYACAAIQDVHILFGDLYPLLEEAYGRCCYDTDGLEGE